MLATRRSFGVKWRGLSTNNGNWVIGGSSGNGVTDGGGTAGTLLIWGSTLATSGLGIGFITDNTILDLELTAMESTL